MSFDAGKYARNPFIKGEDLDEDDRLVVTVKSAEEVTFPSGDVVPVLAFLETDQKLTLNKTRVKKMIDMFGTDSSDWIDRKIALYPIDVSFQGKQTQGVAIAPPPKRSRTTEQRASPKNDVQFMDDDDSAESPF